MKIQKNNHSPVVLFLGGTGYLGSSLMGRLIEKNYQVILLKREKSSLGRIALYLSKINVYDIEHTDLTKIIQKFLPDLVINCAGDYARKLKHTSSAIETNFLLPWKVIEALFDYPKEVIFIHADTSLHKQTNAYALSKKQFIEWVRQIKPPVCFVNVVLDYFYGPEDHSEKFYVQLIRNLLSGVDHIDLTAGEQKRHFIYIEDVVNAFLCIIEHNLFLKKKKCFDQVNVGGEKAVTLKEFIQLIKKMTHNTKTRLNFGILPYRSHEAMGHPISLDKLKRLGWKQNYQLSQGLAKTIAAEQ